MTDQQKQSDFMTGKADAAFQQATAKMIQRAKSTGTPIVVWDDDQKKNFIQNLPQSMRRDGLIVVRGLGKGARWVMT